jgi:hypothetical protein
MKRLYWLLASLVVAASGVSSLVAWASSTHRGYPHVVYHARYFDLATSLAPQGSVEEWIDPAQHRSYTRMRIADETTTMLDIAGIIYQAIEGKHGSTNSVAPEAYTEPPSVLQRDHDLLAGGWRRVYSRLVGQRHGPVTRAHLAGHQVLGLIFTSGTTVWLDARTRLPVEEQLSGTTIRFVQLARIDAYRLPVDFFSPPNTRPPTLWARLVGWVHAFS